MKNHRFKFVLYSSPINGDGKRRLPASRDCGMEAKCIALAGNSFLGGDVHDTSKYLLFCWYCSEYAYCFCCNNINSEYKKEVSRLRQQIAH